MSAASDSSLRNLNDCGCCEGLGIETPLEIANRPGLSAVAYRVGTHSRFKATMLAQLSNSQLAALKQLMTREDDDFSIALLDAWATVADVLTFYQERIANESYLRTATERFSLLQLARLIGYELRPGVAASTYLAFTLEDAQGAPKRATIDVGTKVQSIPGPGEQPQIFETMQKVDARAEWNAIKPRKTQPQVLDTAMTSVVFQGINTNLSKGDRVLIVVRNTSGALDKGFRRVANVTTDNAAQQTTVELESDQNAKSPFYIVPAYSVGSFFTTPFVLNNSTANDLFLNSVWNESDLNAFAIEQGIAVDELFINIRVQLSQASAGPPDTGVFAFRKRASLFGFNAPDWKAMPDNICAAYGSTLTDWPVFPDNTANSVYLDAVYKEIQPNEWAAVTRPDLAAPIVAQVSSAQEDAASYFTLSNKVTELTLAGSVNIAPSNMKELRQTTLYVQSEKLTPAEIPIPDDVKGNVIELDSLYQGLTVGQTILITGTRTDLSGVQASESAELADITHAGGHTTLTLTSDLSYPYARASVIVNANVALATNGETKNDVLGSGEASQAYQQFQLKQSPLTYVSTSTPSGAESTLRVYVNDVEWHEVPTLYGHGARERVFITRTGDDGKTTVEFGDGQTGARLPTGRENVKAVYRKGIGTQGNVKAGQLSLLMTHPLGVKSVNNPEVASGGDDPQLLADARSNAPVTVLTLDRIVSLRDYEDFARSFAGIAKAGATWTWDGQTRGVFVTIAGPKGAAVPDDSNTFKHLLAAMQNSGDPYVPLRVKSYNKALFRISARVKVDPDFLGDPANPGAKVLAAVEQALRDQFSFNARAFGQGVALSEVIAVMQAIPGVVAVDVDKLYRVGDTEILNARLFAAVPQAGAEGAVSAAELLTLDPSPVDLGLMS